MEEATKEIEGERLKSLLGDVKSDPTVIEDTSIRRNSRAIIQLLTHTQ